MSGLARTLRRVFFKGVPTRPVQTPSLVVPSCVPAPLFDNNPAALAPVSRVVLPDLPVELWYEILSYLPKDFVVKMIGVNRYFYEIGMNTIYNYTCLSDIGSTEEKKIIWQVQRHPGLASRVRRLELSPSFLPLCDKAGESVNPVPIKTIRLMEEITGALSNCTDIEAVTIHFHFSRAVTPRFQNILCLFFRNISSNLRSVTITTLTIHVRLMLAISSCTSFPRLEAINITILPSYCVDPQSRVIYVSPHGGIVENLRECIHRMLAAARPNLRELSITNHDLIDIHSIFNSFKGLSPLKVIRYQCCSDSSSLSDYVKFYHFVASFRDLACLSLTTSVKSEWALGPPRHYQESPIYFHTFVAGLLALHLPSLRELHLQLPDHCGKLLLRLSTFCPNLRALKIESPPLDYADFLEFLESVAKFSQGQNGHHRLDHLEFRRLKIFSPAHLKKILGTIPSLKLLAIGFSKLDTSQHGTQPLLYEIPNEVRSEYDALIYRRFRPLSFTDLCLEKVHLQVRTGDGIVYCPSAPQALLDTLSQVLPDVEVLPGLPECKNISNEY